MRMIQNLVLTMLGQMALILLNYKHSPTGCIGVNASIRPYSTVSPDVSSSLATNTFQHYVNETLAFAMKRDGIMYGNMDRKNYVSVEFICEPPQQGVEIWQAAELHAENEFNSWLTTVVKLEKGC